MRTRAAVLRDIGLPRPYAQSRPLSVETVELDPPGPGEMLVRIRAAGVCHSDLSAINGDRPWPVPMVIGHEAAGEVLEIGAGVDDIAVGDHVVLVFRPSCGRCDSCVVGRPAMCAPGAEANGAGSLLGGGRRLHTADGSPAFHHLGCSAFAEHAVISRRSAVKIDQDLPWTEAALFGCAVLTGAGAVFNTARIEAGARVAIVGLGGVGFSALMAAAAAGARDIIAVDLLAQKRERALALGATAVVDPAAPDAVEQVRSLTSGGADYAFEFAGVVPALELAYRITRKGGTTVTASLPNPAAILGLQAVSLIAEERTLKGSYLGSCVPSRDVPRFVAMYRAGRLPVRELMSRTLPLDEVNEALDLLDQGKAVRQVLVMD